MSRFSTRNVSSLASRMVSLQRRHDLIEFRIARELKRPRPDPSALQRLKRLRLQTKDDIAHIAGVLRPVERTGLRRFRRNRPVSGNILAA